MKIEKILIKNFRSLHNIELDNIPSLAVFVGENGSGKSTIFQSFKYTLIKIQEATDYLV